MKFRYGFVTNSSSSSFILGFKSLNDIDHLLETLSDSLSIEDKKSFIIDIKSNMVDKQDALNNYYEYCYQQLFYYGLCDDELDQRQDDVIQLFEEFENKMDGLSIFSVVTYCDDSILGSQMENRILPSLPCTLACLNYH